MGSLGGGGVGFLGVAWERGFQREGCSGRQKMEAFPSQMVPAGGGWVSSAGWGQGIPTGSWEGGVSSAGVGVEGVPARSQGSCQQGMTTVKEKEKS